VGRRIGCGVGGRGQERGDEGLVEIVALAELLDGIGFVFPEDFLADHIEDDVAEILAGADVPVAENGGDHGAKFLKGEKADAVEELGGGDVPGEAGEALLVFLLLLDGEIQGIANEGVYVAMVTRVFFLDTVYCLRKAYFLHAVIVGKCKPPKVGGPGGSVNWDGR